MYVCMYVCIYILGAPILIVRIRYGYNYKTDYLNAWPFLKLRMRMRMDKVGRFIFEDEDRCFFGLVWFGLRGVEDIRLLFSPRSPDQTRVLRIF